MICMPKSVKELLDASIRRVRRIYLLRGIAATFFVAIAATLAVMAVDAGFTLFSDAARWLLSSALYASVLLAGYFLVVRPLTRRLDARRMAKILDGRHPENEECLTTLVELVETAAKNSARANFSEDLLRLLSEKAAAAAAAIDSEREFTSRTVVRRLKALLALAVLLMLAFAIVPHLAGRLFVRAVAPWADVGNLYSSDISVRPGDVVVLGGMVVRIEATVGEGLPYAPSIRISRRTALGWSEEYAEKMNDGVYEATADLSEPEWRYRVCAGPAVSRYYTVRVCEMPRYESFSARIDYPDYALLSPSVVSNDEVSTLEAVAGSRVRFSLDLGARAVKASLRVDGRVADGHEMVSNRTARWTLDLVGKEGFAAPRRGGLLKSFPDAPPTVVVEEPAVKTLRLAPHAKFPIVVSASDDIGVAQLTVRCATDGGAWRDLRPMASCDRTGASLWKGRDEIDLSTFDLADVRTVAFDVVAHDRYPAALGGPHAATSTPVVVQLELKADSIEVQELSKVEAAARKLLDEARRRLDDAKHPAVQARDQLRREKKVNEWTDKAVERAVHEASEARKRVSELERRLREDGRFEPIVDGLRSVREQKLDPALEKLESAQFDAPERRAEALEAALPEMHEALEALRKMDEPLRDRVKRIENYEKTKDLSARQAALARAAEDILRERPVDTRKLEAWKRMQEAAVNQARDLEWRQKDDDVADARRQMSKAAELMEELKRQLDIAADKNRSDIRKAQAGDQYAEELSRRRDEALRQAVKAEKDAEQNLDQARKTGNRGMREAFMRKAAEAQSRAEDLLEQAEATEGTRDAQRAARVDREVPENAEQAIGESLPRQSTALTAAEAELASREKARQESEQARKARADQARRALAGQNAAERLEAQRHEARAAAMKAQAQALAALDEATKSADENRGRQLRQQAADAEREAARQLAKNSANPAREEAQAKSPAAAQAKSLEEAQAKSLAAAQAAVEDPSAAKGADALQRKTADALAAMDKADQLESAAAAKELMERFGREGNLPEDVVQGIEQLKKSDAAPDRTANQLRAEAAAAREDAARKIAAALADGAQGKEDGASNEGRGARDEGEGAREGAQGEQGEQNNAQAAQGEQHGQGESGKSQGRPSVDEKSAEAAETMRRAAERQANALGISEPTDPSAEASRQSSEQEGEGTSRGSESGGGGGVAAEIARLVREQGAKDDPAAVRRTLESQGWFRIKGAAKDGLGGRNLKDVPAEYRDLVRAYFLKLAEEK